MATKSICARKGYRFIGTSTNGVNAFFVHDALAGKILDSLGDVRAWPPRHRDSRNINGQLDFVRGIARRDLVAELPVVDLTDGKLVALCDLYPLYSERFLQDFQ